MFRIGEEGYHKEIIYDDFIVYFDGDFISNVGGTEEYYTETRYVIPFGTPGAITIIVGIAILILGGYKLDEWRIGNWILTLGIIIIVIGITMTAWGYHTVEMKV